MGTAAAIAGGTMLGGAAAMAAGDSGGDIEGHRTRRYTPEQMATLKSLANVVEPQIGEGIDAYDFQVVPGPRPAQREAEARAQTMLDQSIPQMQERAQGLLTPEEWNEQRARDRWQKTVFDPMEEQWQEETRPELMERFAGQGALSSSALSRALADSRSRMETQAQSQLADLMFNSWESNQQRNLQRAQLGQSMLGQTLSQAGQAQQLSEQLRSIEAAQGEEEMKKWRMEQGWANPWLSQVHTVLNAWPFQASTHRTQPDTLYRMGSGMFQGGMGMLGSSI